MAGSISNFASNLKSGLKDAKDKEKSVGGAVKKFVSPGEGKKGLTSRIKSAFKSDKIGKTDPIPKGTDKSAKGLAGVNSKKIKSFFQDLAAGLRAMGKGTFKGIAALALFAPTAVLSIAAIPFLSFIGMVPLKMLKSNLQGLGQGLKSLSKGMMGAVTLLLLAPALALMLVGILRFISRRPCCIWKSGNCIIYINRNRTFNCIRGLNDSIRICIIPTYTIN